MLRHMSIELALDHRIHLMRDVADSGALKRPGKSAREGETGIARAALHAS